MKKVVSRKIGENEAWMKEKCSRCADILFRPMKLGNGGVVSCLAIYLEVAVSNLMLNDSMLGRMINELREFSREELIECISRNELGISDVSPLDTMEDALRAMLAGNLILFIDGYEKAVKISSKGYPAKDVSNAESEKVLKGSNEGFCESVKINTALVRKRIRSAGLKVEEFFMGEQSDTLINIIYMDELAYPNVIEMVKERLKEYCIDGVLDSGVIEQLGEKNWWSPFPQFQTTERPDLAAMGLLNGRIVILCDNTPIGLILPASIHTFMSVSEDWNNRFQIATFQRILRYAALILAMSISGTYLAVVTFHTSILPTNLVLSFAEARKGVPFPSILEVLLMELAFELIREAGLRMPGSLSGTIGIVGGLIIGDAAVSANLVSPMAVVIVAVSALSSFAIPNEELADAFRIMKFGFIFLGGILGMFGIVAGFYIVLGHLSALTSFQIPYLMPFTGRGIEDYEKEGNGIIRKPMKKLRWRPVFARRDQRVRLVKRRKS